VDVRAVMDLAEAYAAQRPSATLIGIGLQKNTRGADQARAVAFIPAVLGQHRGFFYSSGDAHAVNMDRITGRALHPGPERVVSQVGLAPLVASGAFSVVFISGMNPALTLPGQHQLRQGLRTGDVSVVVHDTHWTRSTDYADIVLPALTYLEKEDLVLPWGHSRIRFARRAAAPSTDGWEEVRLVQALARRLGRDEPELYEDVHAALAGALDGALRDGGPEELFQGKTLYLKRRASDDYPTASGKIEFVSGHAAAAGLSALPRVAEETDREGWVMISSALPAYTHTQFQEVYGPIPATATLHPEDAALLSIADGDQLVLANAGGRVTVSAVVSDRVPPGVVWTPRQFEDADGRPLNALCSTVPQTIGGGSTFNSTRVTIRKCS
jgi:anaerobic selenocysteine-containing dehydrogenase